MVKPGDCERLDSNGSMRSFTHIQGHHGRDGAGGEHGEGERGRCGEKELRRHVERENVQYGSDSAF